MVERTVKIGDLTVEVTEPVPVQPVYADLITECRLINGVAVISLASAIRDGESPAEARVVARLRLPIGVVRNIGKMLEDILASASQETPSGPLQ